MNQVEPVRIIQPMTGWRYTTLAMTARFPRVPGVGEGICVLEDSHGAESEVERVVFRLHRIPWVILAAEHSDDEFEYIKIVSKYVEDCGFEFEYESGDVWRKFTSR